MHNILEMVTNSNWHLFQLVNLKHVNMINFFQLFELIYKW